MGLRDPCRVQRDVRGSLEEILQVVVRLSVADEPEQRHGHSPRRGGDACARGDSNPQARGHWNLNPARLPIPPLARGPSLAARRACSGRLGRSVTHGARPGRGRRGRATTLVPHRPSQSQEFPMSALAGKTAVITGSSRGVGAATAKLLAAEGANVVINYRQKAPRANKVVAEIEAAGGKAIAVGADLTDPESVRQLMQTAVDTFGGLDLLVLNASGGMEADLGEDYALRLNRDAQNDALTAGLEHLIEGGRVVFVTSHQAHFIDEVETMPEYEQVARSKRAGETALTERLPEMSEEGVSFVVVSGDMIEGTV